MTGKLDRRQALTAFGTVSLGGLLAACAGDDEPTGAVTTTEGAETSVQTKTTGKATAELFDQSAACQVSAELTEGPYYEDGLELTLTEEGDGVLGVMTLDVERS